MTTGISRRGFGLGGIAATMTASLGTSLRAQLVPARNPLLGMILAPGPKGYCDDVRVGVGTPLWSPKRREWMMWYYGKNEDFDGITPTSLASGYVALATSKDGLSWTRHPGAGPQGAIFWPSADPTAFDCLHVGVTDVTYARGHYWMWYFGGDRTPSVDTRGNHVLGFRTLPGLAKSEDGINWMRVPGPGPGGALFGNGGDVFASWSAVVADRGRFLMHYTSGSGDYEVLRSHVATSHDGVTWEQQGEMRWADGPRESDSKGIIARNLQRNPFPGQRYLMVYSGIDSNPARFKRRSIAAATSEDGIAWTRMFGRPFFTVDGSGGWDAGEVTAPHLIVTDTDMRLYYLGGASRDNLTGFKRGIGVAVSPGRDMMGFQRYAGARLAV